MEKIQCPICGREMEEDSIPRKTPRKYEECIRKCLTCRVGASNGKTNPTFIYEDYRKNIPSSLLNNLDYTLDNCNNLQNRPNKKIKIGYSTSEDAVTWIFINYFIQNQRLEILQRVLNCGSKISEILLWGVPQIDKLFKNPLKDICKNLGENEYSYSEPDIIVVCDGEIVFIEVKVNSDNDTKDRDVRDFDKYLKNDFYLDKDLAKKSKYYELIRNWTIANLFSDTKKIRLLNLAPKKLFYKENELGFPNFIASVNRKENFEQLSWEDVIQTMESNSVDAKIVKEIRTRIR